jgi:hypothetical protein
MMDRLKKLKEKKSAHKMHPLEQKAKMDVVSHLQKMAEDAMGSKLKGMNKVTVASDTPEGLQHGLEHAEGALKHLPQALDDSHPDHENFAHTENKEDGDDGMSAYPDADDDHELEADPAAEHMHDEKEEGDMHKMMLADGGEVGDEDHESDNSSDEESELPNYDDMDRGEMSAHLEALVRAMKTKGLA